MVHRNHYIKIYYKTIFLPKDGQAKYKRCTLRDKYTEIINMESSVTTNMRTTNGKSSSTFVANMQVIPNAY